MDQKTEGAVEVRKKRRRGNLVVFSALGLAAIVTIGIIGGGQAFKAYDRPDRNNVRRPDREGVNEWFHLVARRRNAFRPGRNRDKRLQ